jgi:hypothetical protein
MTADIILRNFNSSYDDVIVRALMMVNRESEYIYDQETNDQGIINRYRHLFADALAFIIQRAGLIWTKRSAGLAQALELETGWSYLPADFLCFNKDDRINYTPFWLKLDTHGKLIIQITCGTIEYIAIPQSLSEIPIVAYEALKLAFLDKCSMLDSNWQALSPYIQEKYRIAMNNLDAEVTNNQQVIRKSRRKGSWIV